MNALLGSVLAFIGLSIPLVIAVSLATGRTLVLVKKDCIEPPHD